MEMTLRNVTAQLGTSRISYTLSVDPCAQQYAFICDASGLPTRLKARDVTGAHQEMRSILESRHNEVLLSSVFWFEKKGDPQVEVTIKDVEPRLISVWIGGLDNDVSSSFYAAIVKSGRYRAALHIDNHIHVELTPADSRRENRYEVFEELLGLLEV